VSATPLRQPFHFGPPIRPLFGVFHPANVAPSGAADAYPREPVATVLCNPFGLEAMSLHRAFRRLAERLANAGVPALRFDYDGTGDSAGSLHDPGRLRAWIDSIHQAVAELRSLVGRGASGVKVVLFGARLGAALAALAALEDGDIASLILWAPVVTGGRYARELRAFNALTAGKTRDRGNDVWSAAGYLLTAPTLAEISSIDLPSTAPGHGFPSRVLLVPGDAVSETERLARHWRAPGREITLGPRVRYSSLLDYPHETVVPERLIAAAVRWVRDLAPDDSRRARAARGAAAPVSFLDVAPVRETLLTFGEGKNLFGVVTEPETGLVASRPSICFLNVGVNHHVGPHRIWVTIARALAAAGYASIRFDFAGVGESEARSPLGENLVYAHTQVDDVRAAMAALEQRQGARRFVLVGLCSGAYATFRTTTIDDRVVGQILVNAHTFDWHEGEPVKSKPSRRFYMDLLRDPGHWHAAVAPGLRARRLRRVLEDLLRSEVHQLKVAIHPRERARRADVRASFQALSERGVESYLVFSSHDGGLDRMSQTFGRTVRGLSGHPHFTLEVLERFDHSFRPLDEQAVLLRLITQYLARHFA
jgi:alpha-beta hydrolase superfamily lysophospholipase